MGVKTEQSHREWTSLVDGTLLRIVRTSEIGASKFQRFDPEADEWFDIHPRERCGDLYSKLCDSLNGLDMKGGE
jgi:hypothetical protein